MLCAKMKTRAFMGGWLAGWLAGLLGWLGWLVRRARDGRDGLKLSSTRKESVHTLPFRRFPRWSFSFSMLQVPSTLSVKGVAGPDQTFHPTPLSPLLFSSLLPPNTVSPSPHFLSRLLFFSCISCSPPFSLSLYISFSCPFFPSFFFLHWFKHRKKRGC